MSNKLFQSVIQNVRECTDRTVGIIDENRIVVACSDMGLIGQSFGISQEEMNAVSSLYVFNGYICKPLYPQSGRKSEGLIFVRGTDSVSELIASMISASLNSMREYYDEKYDRTNFIKNVMLENILPGDIYSKSKDLHFNGEVSRVVLIIKTVGNSEVYFGDIIQGIFPDRAKDFIINIGENELALVKEVKPNIDVADLEKLARSIIDTLTGEMFPRTVIGIGTVVNNLRDISRSFKEAQVSIEVGKVFDDEKTIISYNNLGIGRLIYYLPTTLCNMFLNEVFKKGSIDVLDHETLFTIQKFFENNLNVSETSRKLFVHRNTLVYRLEKIRRLTGLDLKQFDDAIVFKVALMVRKYLSSNPTKF